jgi:hypothetical protein
MQGPHAPGHWTARTPPQPYGPLTPGLRYEVASAFVDYDGDEHPVGECWVYLGHNFLPYDDGLSLFVSRDGRQEWHIRLQDRPEEQGGIVRALHGNTLLRALSRPLVAPAPAPRMLRWGWPGWMALCAVLGAVLGSALIAGLREKTPAVLATPLVLAAAGVMAGRSLWRKWQWQALGAAIPVGTHADAVARLLGPPSASIDLFTDGDAVATHVFKPAVYAPARFNSSLACDFDVQDRLVAMRRLKPR